MTVRVVGPRDPRVPGVVNTTSNSWEAWSRGLSPFYLGPVPLYEGAGLPFSKNVENAWQYSKVYADQIGPDGLPTPEYFRWAREGWSALKAVRYPRGKGARPDYSWWGRRLTYVEARKVIYIPLYARAVLVTPAWAQLLGLYREKGEVTLWDFDGYDHAALGMSLADVVNLADRKMGHAFVLAHLLARLR